MKAEYQAVNILIIDDSPINLKYSGKLISRLFSDFVPLTQISYDCRSNRFKNGSRFFRSCVYYLSKVIQVRYDGVFKLLKTSPLQLENLAFWNGEKLTKQSEDSAQKTQ